MNVPHARSRISLAPSPVKKGGRVRQIPPVSGEGIFDVLKSVGKAVAPVAIDLASSFAKNKLGSGLIPLKVSASQKRNLKRGGAITIKPSMVTDVAKDALKLLPATAKKVMNAISKNKGIRVALKQGEDLINQISGKGLFDVVKSVGKAVAPVAIDLASSYAKKKVMGEGIMDVVNSVGKAVAPVAIDLASSYAKKKVGGATKKYIPKRKLQGGSFMPAGGSIYPAGMYGKGIDNPIQLGSPYQYSNSPAMSPFIPDRSIQSYNPIKSKQGSGVIGSTIGQVLGSMLPI